MSPTNEEYDEAFKQPNIPDNEKKIEAAIQAKGLNAPRLSPTHINEQIIGEAYYVFPDTSLTVCCLTLRNGFQVIGESAAASIENFDEAIGKRIAKDKAREKIWQLEGYLLGEKQMTDWNTSAIPPHTEISEAEPETEETELSPEDKAERKRERQNTKYTCLELAVRAANGNADSDNIITGAAKFYAFVTGTKVRAKKEG